MGPICALCATRPVEYAIRPLGSEPTTSQRKLEREVSAPAKAIALADINW